MDRKDFISSLLLAGVSIPVPPIAGGSASNNGEEQQIFKIPKYLNAGDRIGITCPAGFITREDIEPAVQQIQSWGLQCVIGLTVGKRDHSFGGTDEERAADFQRMLDDPSLKAILCARGGYGIVRIIDKLNFNKFIQKPKWIIGFSDVTVIHSHINSNYGIASIHSKMCNSFPDDWSVADPIQMDTILSIKKALLGEKLHYGFDPNPFNRTGTAEGPLVGGNLKTIETISGTKSMLSTAGKILFVEDTGEYLYSIDRMFWHLKRAGQLSKLKALIVGGFKVKPDDPGEEFGRMVQEIVLEKVKSYSYPVCFDFPVGHQKNNYALKCGATHRLEVKPDSCILREIVLKKVD